MNEISKSIWVGTVDFFGIMIPGVLIIVMCTVGFFAPLVLVVIDLSKAEMPLLATNTNSTLVVLFLLFNFSYVFGYILRLSSPDTLDRKSAIKVIRGECAKNSQKIVPLTILEWINSIKYMPLALGNWFTSIKNTRQIMQGWIEADKWPFNPGDPGDKYPYLNFREYLKTWP